MIYVVMSRITTKIIITNKYIYNKVGGGKQNNKNIIKSKRRQEKCIKKGQKYDGTNWGVSSYI